jgi:SNF2 family DNA or RNA helicase
VQYLIEPWKHQREAIERAASLNEFALFFEVGAGKTSTCINILRQKYSAAGRVMRTLILCPPIVIENWRREFCTHSRVGDRVLKLVGTGKQRLGLMVKHRDLEIIVTNFETLLMKEVFTALKAFAPEILVVDESHKCKDLQAKRTKAVISLAEIAQYRYILSGTPILNSPMDIFAQYRILDKGATFGKNFYTFRAEYFYDKNSSMPRDRYFPSWQIRPGALEAINKKISAKGMHVTKKDCLDLPPLVRETIYVDLSTEQQKLYNELKSDYIAFVNDKAIVAQLAITKALRLMQLVSGFVVTEGVDGAEREATSFKDNPRLAALKEILEQTTGHSKCLVWAVFKENYAAIRKVCDDLSIGYVEVTGEVSAAKKVEAVDRFNTDPDCRVLLGHPASGGIGINLIAASYSIFYSRNFSLEQDLQAEARNYRGGSEIHEKITRIDLVAANTIDELITKRLASKIEISDKVLRDIANEL